MSYTDLTLFTINRQVAETDYYKIGELDGYAGKLPATSMFQITAYREGYMSGSRMRISYGSIRQKAEKSHQMIAVIAQELRHLAHIDLSKAIKKINQCLENLSEISTNAPL